jgi:2-phospho-L-lactate guanylyltransferase
MKTVLLPVKDFAHAKQRLASALQPRQRAGLARAMLSDVLAALGDARRPDRIVICTASEEVAEVVRPYDFDIVHEMTARGHSEAVNAMVDELSRTASRILSIASDLPRLTSVEIDSVLDSSIADVSFVSSRDGTGTNAALFVLPARIRMQYGDDSLRRHRASAEAAHLSTCVLSVPGMEFDIDTPDDLQAYFSLGSNSSFTWRFISRV